ncbi:MAG: hypothetical protein ACO1G6_09370 [Bacteroidota bacterium]
MKFIFDRNVVFSNYFNSVSFNTIIKQKAIGERISRRYQKDAIILEMVCAAGYVDMPSGLLKFAIDNFPFTNDTSFR